MQKQVKNKSYNQKHILYNGRMIYIVYTLGPQTIDEIKKLLKKKAPSIFLFNFQIE